MIIPMFKYDFMVFYDDHNTFLDGLRDLGVLHIKPYNSDISSSITDVQTRLKKIRDTKSLLSKQTIDPTLESKSLHLNDGQKIIAGGETTPPIEIAKS